MTTNRDTGGPPGASWTLGALLRALRERALLTQEQLAVRAGVSVGTVRGVEAGRIRRPRSASVQMLANALGLADREREALVAAARGEQARPAEHANPPPHQLPADIRDFTGRADELKRLDEWLPAPGGIHPAPVVIAVITGTAGVGKTALAIHWSHRVADQFPDGQVYVNLQGFATGPPLAALQALAHVLHGLGVQPDKIPSDLEQAAGLYRSLLARRRVLVVLDNARDPEQVRPLLPGGPGCLVVITSRDRFAGLVASHGARQLTLDVLTPGEAVTLLGRVAGQDRVAASADAAAELVGVCGHLPLAVRVAAANLACHPGLSIISYVAALQASDRLTGLAVEGDRQMAVRAAFDCSYRALDGNTRRLFRLLGLVPGPEFSESAAVALAATTSERVELLLDRLVGAHLIEPRGPGRFAIHDLLRVYAQQLAEREDGQAQQQAARQRLYDWYLRSADTAARLLYPHRLRLPVPPATAMSPAADFDDHAGAMRWLDLERIGLVAAVQDAAEQGPLRVAWLLADALRGYCWLRGHTIDWLAASHAGLTAAVHEGDLQAQAAMRLSLGDAHHGLANHDQAVQHCTAAAQLARRAGWTEGQAAALGNLGNVYHKLGRLEDAGDAHHQALGLYRQTGRQAGQAITHGNLAVVNRDMGRLRQAAEHATQALALHRQTGSRAGEALALDNLGAVNHALGHFEEGLDHLNRALTLMRELGNRYGEAGTLHDLAALHRDAGDQPLALELSQAALAEAREIGDRHIETECLNTLGTIRLALGCPQQAIDCHRHALRLACQSASLYPQAEALLGLAGAHLHANQLRQSVVHAEQALAIAREAGYQVLEGRARTTLADSQLAGGQRDQAIEQARQALAMQRQTGHRLGQARTLELLSRALYQTESAEGALACWQEALALLTEIGAPKPAGPPPSSAPTGLQ